MASSRNLGRGVLVLLFALLSLSGPQIFNSANATVYSNNAFANPSFETQPAICDAGQSGCAWRAYRDAHSTPSDATVTTDPTRSVNGTYSAKIDMTISNPIGFIGLYQVLPFPQNVLRFNNLTDRSDGLDFWFYVEPKYNGMGDVELRVLALNAREMDYVFDPDPILSYPNQTFPDGRLMVKTVQVFGYPAGQWHHFTRDLRTDWQLPAKMPSGTFMPGYGLNESINWVEFDATEFQDYKGNTYSETAWVDDMTIYYDSTSPPLPQPPSNPPANPSTSYTPTFEFLVIGSAIALFLLCIVALARRGRKRQLRNGDMESLSLLVFIP